MIMKTKTILLLAALGALTIQAGPFQFPTQSAHRLDMVNTPTYEGVAGFLNWPGYPQEPTIPPFDHGHLIDRTIVSNSSALTYPNDYVRAYYYMCGAEHTPPFGPITHIAAAHGSALTGMPATQLYLSNHPELSLASLKYKYGAIGADQTKTWNLHGDVQGVNWFGSPASTIEERIYQANPADVTWGLYYNGLQIITFEYSDLYAIFDYGASTSHDDDMIRAFSSILNPYKNPSLPTLENGLAEAILSDVNTQGGAVRLTFDTIQSATREDSFQSPWLYGLFSFQGSMQIVSPSAQPSYNLQMYAGIEITGNIGDTCQVWAKTEVDTTWTALDRVTLTAPIQKYFDTNSPSLPKRFYKVTPLQP